VDLNQFVKNNPKRVATDKQKDLAFWIAFELELDEPDYDSFVETSEFISDHMEEFEQVMNAQRAERLDMQASYASWEEDRS